MSDSDWKLKTTFEKGAELYDKARPQYPEQLVKDVLTLSEIPSNGRILEVGCGTGQATLLFARHVEWVNDSHKEHFVLFGKSFSRRSKDCPCFDLKDLKELMNINGE
jgi:SAM-dependent methyltransferase